MKRKAMQFAEHGGQSRVIAFVALRLLLPLFWFILAIGQVCFLPIQVLAHSYALGGAQLNAGFSPASVNTSNLPQSQVVQYDKNFIKNLKANTPYVRCTERRELPENSGNQHRLFMYSALGANIAQTSEGMVQDGIQVSVLNNTNQIGQYADYANLSDLSMATAIDPALENIQRELAYRLGLTLSTLVKNTADGMKAIDAKVNGNDKAANVPFGKSDVTTNVQSLAGQNVKPFDRGRYCGIIHPFMVGDTLNDTANNSLSDILKHTAEGQMKLEELPAPDGDEVQVMDWAGVTFYATTLVTQTANYLASGKTALRTYIFGEDALISISLGRKENAMIGNGDWRNLKLWMYKSDEPSKSDPSRVIGGWTSYNTKYTVTTPPDTTMRGRTVDAVSNIA